MDPDGVVGGRRKDALDGAATGDQLAELIRTLEGRMREAAKQFEFEKAAQLRDRIKSLKQQDLAGMFAKEGGERADGSSAS